MEGLPLLRAEPLDTSAAVCFWGAFGCMQMCAAAEFYSRVSSMNFNQPFSISSFPEGLSGWSQPVMGNHPMHQQLSDPGTFSQHQPMERDDSGIVAPSNIFHQPMPNSFVDFSKVSYRGLDLVYKMTKEFLCSVSCLACLHCVCLFYRCLLHLVLNLLLSQYWLAWWCI